MSRPGRVFWEKTIHKQAAAVIKAVKTAIRKGNQDEFTHLTGEK